VPAVFTCVNDYADLSGELSLWHQAFRARLVLPPQRNPFRAVTVAHAPGEESTTWYCANSFFYAVQGYEGDMEAIRDGHEPVKVSPNPNLSPNPPPGGGLMLAGAARERRGGRSHKILGMDEGGAVVSLLLRLPARVSYRRRA